MRYEYTDVQNIAVKVFLYQLSRKLNFFDNWYKQKTLEYFDYKCPYSGADISGGKFVADHIIALNKEYCGLHVFGNVLLVTREACARRHHQELNTFLNFEPEKLVKIQNFMQESGFSDAYEKYYTQLKLSCAPLYEKIRSLVENDFENFATIAKVSDFKSSAISAQLKADILLQDILQEPETETVTDITSGFKLLKTDKNNNKFYILPQDEVQFKKEAFTDGQIFIKVIHQNDYKENVVRRVSKLWTSSVYCNIHNMPSSYKGLVHLGDGENLKVYACPLRYKNSIINV